MPSKITVPVAIRIPVAIAAKARTNAAKKGETLSVYLGKIITLQVGRKR